jgi:UDP-N-acetylglucosamine 2-epimerase (non-hydrolysing)
MKLLAVIGTRPEAIKMAPVLIALGREPEVELRLCVTAQHRQMLDTVLSLFGLVPDLDLDLMEEEQGLNALAGRCFSALDAVLADDPPDRVLVHGDTTTAMATALAAFHRGLPLAHVEAGLRTHDLAQPFPEEMNRRAIDLVSDLLFAPTPLARRNLEAEGARGAIHVTGNTGVDALALALAKLDGEGSKDGPPGGARRILVTAHRRESLGADLAAICDAVRRLARRGDVEIVWPVHLNPRVSEPVHRALGGERAVRLVPPLGYLPLVREMRRSDLILTDSGGLQEEAPSLGTPVLVLRDLTERPEAVEAGRALLVGTDPDRIVREAEALLGGRPVPRGPNPYGDGKASERIVAALLGRPFAPFEPA